jgi:hypothetical protein
MLSKTGKSLQEKLERTLEDEDFYQALQIYKTLYVRNMSANNISGAEELLVHGTEKLLEQSQVEAGTELSTLLFKHFIDQGFKLDKRTQEIVSSLFRKYPVELDTQKRRFISFTEKWIAQHKDNDASQLYDIFAQEFELHKEYFESERHYIRGTNPIAYADMLVSWSNQVMQEEKDLIIVRSVIRYLALKNPENALVILNHFLKQVPLDSPLINYSYFLIKTCSSGSREVFLILRQKYKPSLAREKSFAKYLDHIAKIFFGIDPQPQGMGGILGNLLKGFGGAMNNPAITSK